MEVNDPPMAHAAQTRLATAAIAAVLVRTLDGGLQSFEKRFVENLRDAMSEMTEAAGDLSSTIETLAWLEQILK